MTTVDILLFTFAVGCVREVRRVLYVAIDLGRWRCLEVRTRFVLRGHGGERVVVPPVKSLCAVVSSIKAAPA